MPRALFDINDDGEDRGHQAAANEQLRFKLRNTAGVTSVVFQVFSEDAFDVDAGIAANPPRASKGAPIVELVGATNGASVSPATLGGEVTVNLPETGGHSYIVRCVVNGGMRQLPGGVLVTDPSLIHERGIWTPTESGARKAVCTEVTQFEVDGWAGALADFAELGGSPGPQGNPGPQGDPGPPGVDTVDQTLILDGTELRRAAINYHMAVQPGSNVAHVVLLPTTAGVDDAKGAVPYMIHRRITNSGAAASISGVLELGENGFVTGFPFDARLVDAWIFCTQNQSGSSVQFFKNSTAGGNELTSILSTASQGQIRNADNQSRTIAAGDSIIMRKNGGALVTVTVEVVLVFMPGPGVVLTGP